MRSGLWPRRLPRWRTRKSLPTDQAALRAASATARDVSRGSRPGGRVVSAWGVLPAGVMAPGVVRARTPGRGTAAKHALTVAARGPSETA